MKNWEQLWKEQYRMDVVELDGFDVVCQHGILMSDETEQQWFDGYRLTITDQSDLDDQFVIEHDYSEDWLELAQESIIQAQNGELHT